VYECVFVCVCGGGSREMRVPLPWLDSDYRRPPPLLDVDHLHFNVRLRPLRSCVMHRVLAGMLRCGG